MSEEIIKEAEAYKVKGNEALKNKKNNQAIEFYTKAIELHESHIYYTNRSAAYFKVFDCVKSLADADKAVALNPKWIKGYFRQCQVYKALEMFPEAKNAAKAGLALQPENKDLLWEIKDMDRTTEEAIKKEKKANEKQDYLKANPQVTANVFKERHVKPWKRKQYKDQIKECKQYAEDKWVERHTKKWKEQNERDAKEDAKKFAVAPKNKEGKQMSNTEFLLWKQERCLNSETESERDEPVTFQATKREIEEISEEAKKLKKIKEANEARAMQRRKEKLEKECKKKGISYDELVKQKNQFHFNKNEQQKRR